jgi:hypothetical protein
MARIDIKSAGGTALDTGILQLENGVAMDATLRKVADQNNTTSPLKLSTTGVQTTSKLQITTADTNYIDAEDNAGNNRFTVGRGVASQLVTVDFASTPTALTTPVGAIRTATDGVNLANVQTFLENGNIGFGTDTPGSKIDVHSAANTVAQFNRTGTGNSQIQHLMTGTARWTVGYTSTAGNYSIYDNVNAVFRTNLSNTGKLTIGNGDTALTGQLNVKGAGSTSATTSLLVQNSSASDLFKITDNGQVSIPPINSSSISNLVINAGLLSNSTAVGIDLVSGQFAAQFYLRALGATTAGYPSAILGKVLFQAPSGLVITSNNAGTLSNTDIAVYVYQSKSVHINGFTEVASAVLNAESTSKGFLPPRMTTAQKNAIGTPAAGLMVYDTTLNKLCVYTTAWETITSI